MHARIGKRGDGVLSPKRVNERWRVALAGLVAALAVPFLIVDSPAPAQGVETSAAESTVEVAAPAVEVEELLETWPNVQLQLVDIREDGERKREGAIPGSIHLPYGRFASHCTEAGALRGLNRNARLLIYCAVGERSTLAVEIADEHGLKNIAHLPGGFRAWKTAGGSVETVD